MSTPIEDVADRIEGLGLGLSMSDPANLFRAIMPERHDDAVSVMPGGGSDPDFTLDTLAPRHDNVRVAVWVRSSLYSTAEALAWSIYYRLFAVGLDIGSSHYLWIRPMQPPFLISRDERHRVIVGINFAVKRATPDLS